MIENSDLPKNQQLVTGLLPSAKTECGVFLTVDEAADLLRTSRKAVYAMSARGQLPGVTRLRRRVLIRSADLLHWLGQKSAPSPKE
jgi:excisionase family DNA binding protein